LEGTHCNPRAIIILRRTGKVASEDPLYTTVGLHSGGLGGTLRDGLPAGPRARARFPIAESGAHRRPGRRTA